MSSTALDRPRLTLRIGFAGIRDLTDTSPKLIPALEEVFAVLSRRLIEIAPSTPIDCGPKTLSITDYYHHDQKPLMRLVSGFAEGADTLAHECFDRATTSTKDLKTHLETEHAGVLAFPIDAYRDGRDDDHHATFDELVEKSAWVLTLDGIYEKTTPDTPLASKRRSRGYRAQSEFLLRQSDFIIAVADPDAKGGAGGTLETIRAASQFELPVIFIHAGTGDVYLVDPEQTLDMTLAPACPVDESWQEALPDWLDNVVADPDVEDHHKPHGQQEFQRELLDEFFSKEHEQEGQHPWNKRSWKAFQKRFEPKFPEKAKPSSLEPDPYDPYRKRSKSLNYHYTALYRSAYLLNFRFAVYAVFLAALSLVLLGKVEHSKSASQLQDLIETALEGDEQALAKAHAEETKTPVWVLPALLLFGLGKLGLVGWIFLQTHRANHHRWNDRAVDYRYLAERLRALHHLPHAGSFQPPAAAAPQYASRVTRQSAIDWLLDAIVRSISPLEVIGDGSKIITLDPKATTHRVRDQWIHEQIGYHDRNARTMGAMEDYAESWGKVFNIAVIIFVILDIGLVLAHLFHILPEPWDSWTHTAAPWLVFLAAVLPAAVAGFNGIRFQSECQRLAERSAVMRAILRGRQAQTEMVRPLRHVLFPSLRPKAIPLPEPPPGGRWKEAHHLAECIEVSQDPANQANDPGAWSAETLRLTEKVANDFVQEVAEWSVLYAKEMPEP